MQDFGKHYIGVAFLSMFFIPGLRSLVFDAEPDGVLETIAAFLWPIGIPAFIIYDVMNRHKYRGNKR